ncbi:unnamed protein product [marine sediment metagenome]|uniref:Uncharacterized protein n=1 Tax=marine sediment metagenome TaxID=412755 RepID=X1F882_9ZZZZ
MEKDRKFPSEKMSLRQMNEKGYIDRLEWLIVEEGKRILNSLKISHMIITQENIQKYNDSHPIVAGLTWHQVGFERIYKKYHTLNAHQYRHLIAMKQVLNKNNKYLLRRDEFDNRERILECDRFKNQDTCLVSDCKSAYLCPKYYENNGVER